MNHQDDMNNDAFDEQLPRLFAEKNEPLPDDKFMQQVLSGLNRQQRLQWIGRGLMTLAILVLAAVLSPWVVQGTMNLFAAAWQVARLPGVDTTISLVTLLIGAVVFFRVRKRVFFS